MTRPTISSLFPYTTLFRSGLNALDLLGDPVQDLAGSLIAVLPQMGFQHFPDHAHELTDVVPRAVGDRKSTRLNSSHVKNSYAVFCLKKKSKTYGNRIPQHH